VVEKANQEFADLYNAKNYTGCGSTYTADAAHFSFPSTPWATFLVGREAISASWAAAAKANLTNPTFQTVEAVAHKESNVIHEFGIATSNLWPAPAGIKYYLRWAIDSDGNPWLSSDISPLAPPPSASVVNTATTTSLTDRQVAFAKAHAAGVVKHTSNTRASSSASSLERKEKFPSPYDVVEAANAALAETYNVKKDYAACADFYTTDTVLSSQPVTPWGHSINAKADITAFWAGAAAGNITGLSFETDMAVATGDFTVIHELGRVYSNVWPKPTGLEYYVRWDVSKVKGRGRKAKDYTALLSVDISPL